MRSKCYQALPDRVKSLDPIEKGLNLFHQCLVCFIDIAAVLGKRFAIRRDHRIAQELLIV